MVRAIAYRGPDGAHPWVHQNVGLAHLAFATTSEAGRERQPLVDPETGIALVGDIRIDNREDLIARLAGSGQLHLNTPTDIELALAAYKRWKNEFPREILGDFALALWDPRERQLLLTRDIFGLRQLVYAPVNGTVVFGTTVGAVRAALSGEPPINPRLLMSLLREGFGVWTRETAYATIFRVPPATVLTFRDCTPGETTYWVLHPRAERRTDTEWLDAFRSTFEDAVRVRLRTPGPVAVVVSGGLDSSSVACVGHQLAGSPSPAGALRLYSLALERTPRADERQYQRAVSVACSGRPFTPIPGDDLCALQEFGRDSGFDLDEPEVEVNRNFLSVPFRRAASDGCRVVFTGHGGDEVLGGRAYFQPDLLADVGLHRLWTELEHFRRGCRQPAWRLLLYTYGRQIIPRGLVRAARRWSSPPSLRNLEFALDVNYGRKDRRAMPTCSAQVVHERLDRGYYRAHLQMLERVAANESLEIRLPFLDRRVVECLVSIPPHLRFRDGWSKYILRHALRDYLPECVRERRSHSEFSGLIDRGLLEVNRQRVEALLSGSHVAREGLLDPSAIARMWSVYRQGSVATERLLLTRLLCVEEWLRTRNLSHEIG